MFIQQLLSPSIPAVALPWAFMLSERWQTQVQGRVLGFVLRLILLMPSMLAFRSQQHIPLPFFWEYFVVIHRPLCSES